MSKWLCLLLSLPLLAASPEQEVRRVLDDQVAAWNRGDIRAFMDGYEDSDSITFVGADVTKGRAQVLANYLKKYPTKEKMGALEFSGLEIAPFGDGYASVLGRWHLGRAASAGGDAGGFFTLLLRRTATGWKIFLDHTS
jgi:uncharacterized protein (TIGR02246 family)